MFKALVFVSLVLACASPAHALPTSPPTGTCEVKLEDYITEEKVKKIISDIERKCSREWKLKINISSKGGRILYAIDLYKFLLKWPHEVATHGVSVQSAAVIVFLAGRKRTMSQDGVLMIHPIVSELEAGSYTRSQLLEYAHSIMTLSHDNVNIITKVAKLPRDKVLQLVASSTEMSANRARELGFVHEVVP